MTAFLSLSEAIAEYVHDGDMGALEGFTHLNPFAAGHEVIRQGRRELTLARMTPDLIYDQMAGTERDSAYHRLNHGIRTNGLAVVVTDLCLLGPHPISKELTVVSMHEGVMREQIAGATGWPVRFVDEVAQTPAPTESELRTLRNLQEATARSQG